MPLSWCSLLFVFVFRGYCVRLFLQADGCDGGQLPTWEGNGHTLLQHEAPVRSELSTSNTVFLAKEVGVHPLALSGTVLEVWALLWCMK